MHTLDDTPAAASGQQVATERCDLRLVRSIAWFCNESKEVNMEIRFNGWQWILLAFAIISGLAVNGIFRLVWWIVSHVRWV